MMEVGIKLSEAVHRAASLAPLQIVGGDGLHPQSKALSRTRVETILTEGHPLASALAGLSQQSDSSAKRTTT